MIKSGDSCWLSNEVIHTLKVLRTLSLLTGLADNLDRSARERADNAFRLVVGSRSHDFDQSLDLFLLLVNIGDEELLSNTATDVGGASGGVVHVESLARGTGPLD